jgi:hypothetical protein
MSYGLLQEIIIVYTQEIPGMSGTYNFTRVTMVQTFELIRFYNVSILCI